MNDGSAQHEAIAAWLVTVCGELCAAEQVTPDSDFFDLGGNSLTSIRLLSRVEHRFGAGVLSPETLFADGRLSELARSIEVNVRTRGDTDRSDEVA